MAIVGDRNWEAEVQLFTGKGIRRVPIEYYEPADLAKAKAWLASLGPVASDWPVTSGTDHLEQGQRPQYRSIVARRPQLFPRRSLVLWTNQQATLPQRSS